MSIELNPNCLPEVNLTNSPLILEAATIFIALVILAIEVTDFILSLICFSLTANPLYETGHKAKLLALAFMSGFENIIIKSKLFNY